MKSILIVLVCLFCFSCTKKKLDLPNGVPVCIAEKLPDGFFFCAESGEVSEFSFQGETVYVFSQGNCGADLSASVFDSDCNELGYLGGIAGNVDINGVNFDQNARFLRKIWEP